ncbi:hypothetical protein COLINT_01989 [Collinsella intestinalis DSM 13280]|uniref:Cytoplasmic protein n=1 Tax=Collinsella intestinalis DSM 13280 TaxID=521003 RepID=C4F7H4_9ACTN|nr:DUF1788 domain-containing protein [Collinsella intestinalis]EEP45197.1 hypothetical protein COLINT_01989 [Collinsella intestinalis DSM 13280]
MNAIDSPTLTQSFEVIRSKLRDPEFLACHGLGNEVPFHVFPYDAGSELEVRALLRDLLSEDPAGLAPGRITHIDLWELICDLCEQRGLMEKLPAFERKRGSDALLVRLQTIASPAKLVEHMRERFAAAHGDPQPGRDVLLISGVGRAYPITRAHQILECAQPIFSHIPVVLFYPGVYDGQTLRLFGSINDGNYYRAFNIL